MGIKINVAVAGAIAVGLFGNYDPSAGKAPVAPTKDAALTAFTGIGQKATAVQQFTGDVYALGSSVARFGSRFGVSSASANGLEAVAPCIGGGICDPGATTVTSIVEATGGCGVNGCGPKGEVVIDKHGSRGYELEAGIAAAWLAGAACGLADYYHEQFGVSSRELGTSNEGARVHSERMAKGTSLDIFPTGTKIYRLSAYTAPQDANNTITLETGHTGRFGRVVGGLRTFGMMGMTGASKTARIVTGNRTREGVLAGETRTVDDKEIIVNGVDRSRVLLDAREGDCTKDYFVNHGSATAILEDTVLQLDGGNLLDQFEVYRIVLPSGQVINYAHVKNGHQIRRLTYAIGRETVEQTVLETDSKLCVECNLMTGGTNRWDGRLEVAGGDIKVVTPVTGSSLAQRRAFGGQDKRGLITDITIGEGAQASQATIEVFNKTSDGKESNRIQYARVANGNAWLTKGDELGEDGLVRVTWVGGRAQIDAADLDDRCQEIKADIEDRITNYQNLIIDRRRGGPTVAETVTAPGLNRSGLRGATGSDADCLFLGRKLHPGETCPTGTPVDARKVDVSVSGAPLYALTGGNADDAKWPFDDSAHSVNDNAQVLRTAYLAPRLKYLGRTQRFAV